MLPNLIAPILVYSTLLIPTNILSRRRCPSLAWYPPTHPELGRNAVRRRRLPTQPHFMFWPGMAIFVTVLALQPVR